MSNWYQNLDYKLIRDHVRLKINISWILVAAKRLWGHSKNMFTRNLYFCLPPLSIHVHFKCDPCSPSTYACSSELPHPLSKLTMFLHRHIYIYTVTIKIFTSHKKKFEKMEIGLTPPPFVRFYLLFKRTQRSALLLNDEPFI